MNGTAWLILATWVAGAILSLAIWGTTIYIIGHALKLW